MITDRLQRFDTSGSPMSEAELFLRSVDHLQSAATCFRGIAAHRKDARWLLPVRILDQVVDRVKRLRDQGGARVLWLPDREGL
jgi:hypothetical protein